MRPIPPITRRDFLKYAGLLPLSLALPSHLAGPSVPPQWIPGGAINSAKNSPPNVLVVVFDAWSASNLSLYGYPRKTTPNIEKLAEKAIVYHNHYAGGNFTTPGTASLLTGALPWTHRALKIDARVSKAFTQKNLFHAFNTYHRFAYSHNPLVNTLLEQFFSDIDSFIPWETLYLGSDSLVTSLFKFDADAASVGWNRILKQQDGYSYSLFLSQLYRFIKNLRAQTRKELAKDFPLGLPNNDEIIFFTLEQGIDWLLKQTAAAPQPFAGYVHFFPPHDPYCPRVDVCDRFFKDGYRAEPKPLSLFKEDRTQDTLDYERRIYDEYILYVDAEFARLYQALAEQGILENTWLVLTSDHGELFERGILRHTTPVLYQPVTHIPLLIFPPGQTSRVDVHDKTSVIDLLPTLMHVTGQEIPDWTEGVVLPPFATASAQNERDIFAFHGDVNGAGKFNRATSMLVRGSHKLVYYFGYNELGQNGPMIELFNLAEDPEELNNLYPAQKSLAEEMLATVKEKLAQANPS